MSQADVERFVEDLKNDAGLREELKGQAAGVASVVEFAKGKGYDIGADEARAYIQAQASRDLSDEELDAIAGGKGHHHHHHHSTSTVTQVSAVQTAYAATTADVAAEVVAVIVLT